MAYLYFEEKQQFRQAWLWILIGITTILAVVVPVITSGIVLTSRDFVIFMLTPVLIVLLFFILRLNTRVDQDGIYFRFVPFHWKDRFIAWDDVVTAEVIKYSPLADYGGWGIKYGRKGKAFNVSGNMGLYLTLKNGKRLLIGTAKPDELSDVVHKILLRKRSNIAHE